MRGVDLLSRLRAFGELDVGEAQVMGWIDTAQQKVSLDLPIVRDLDIPSIFSGESVSIETGVFKLISVRSSEGDYDISKVEIRNDSLVFHDDLVNVVIKITSVSPPYTNMQDELSIHPALHAPMLYYLISMYYDMEGEGDDEESGLAERFYQRWVYYRNQAISNIQNSSDVENFEREPIEMKDVLRHPKRKARRNRYYE